MPFILLLLAALLAASAGAPAAHAAKAGWQLRILILPSTDFYCAGYALQGYNLGHSPMRLSEAKS